MKKGGIGRTVLLGVGLAVIAVLAYLVWQHFTGGAEHPNWEKVHFGHSREQVLEQMGEPSDETPEFPLRSPKERAEAGKSRAVTWLIYRRGNVTYVICLAKDGRVAHLVRGGP